MSPDEATNNDPLPAGKVDRAHVPPAALNALLGVEGYLRECGLERGLIHLVKLLASYRNRCAYCVDMHTKDARALGETEMRLYATGVWRDTPFFSPRERAAFALTEALTRLDPAGIPEAVLAETRRHFSETELVNLSMVIIAINMWNRFTAVVHSQAASYQPGGQHR